MSVFLSVRPSVCLSVCRFSAFKLCLDEREGEVGMFQMVGNSDIKRQSENTEACVFILRVFMFVA